MTRLVNATQEYNADWGLKITFNLSIGFNLFDDYGFPWEDLGLKANDSKAENPETTA